LSFNFEIFKDQLLKKVKFYRKVAIIDLTKKSKGEEDGEEKEGDLKSKFTAAEYQMVQTLEERRIECITEDKVLCGCMCGSSDTSFLGVLFILFIGKTSWKKSYICECHFDHQEDTASSPMLEITR
jgi:hypothetical protein